MGSYLKLVVTKVRQEVELPVDSMVETLVVLEEEYKNMCEHLPEWAYTTYEKYCRDADKRRLAAQIEAIKKKLRKGTVE